MLHSAPLQQYCINIRCTDPKGISITTIINGLILLLKLPSRELSITEHDVLRRFMSAQVLKVSAPPTPPDSNYKVTLAPKFIEVQTFFSSLWAAKGSIQPVRFKEEPHSLEHGPSFENLKSVFIDSHNAAIQASTAHPAVGLSDGGGGSGYPYF